VAPPWTRAATAPKAARAAGAARLRRLPLPERREQRGRCKPSLRQRRRCELRFRWLPLQSGESSGGGAGSGGYRSHSGGSGSGGGMLPAPRAELGPVGRRPRRLAATGQSGLRTGGRPRDRRGLATAPGPVIIVRWRPPLKATRALRGEIHAGPASPDAPPRRRHALLAAAILGGALIGVFFAFESDLPSHLARGFPAEHHHAGLRRRRSVLGEFAIEKRWWSSSGTFPRLRNAIVAVEDADFWKHIGSTRGASQGGARQPPLRPPWAGLLDAHDAAHRLLFLTREDLRAQDQGGILAFQIEKNFTKEEILTLYCNQIYFGTATTG